MRCGNADQLTSVSVLCIVIYDLQTLGECKSCYLLSFVIFEKSKININYIVVIFINE